MAWVLDEVRKFYSGINPATLSGAIDVIVVRQPDGQLKCTPFHVRFGKLSLLRTKERVVHMTVNDEPVEGLGMKVGSAGEAFFVHKTTDPDSSAAPLSPPDTEDDRSETARELGDLAPSSPVSDPGMGGFPPSDDYGSPGGRALSAPTTPPRSPCSDTSSEFGRQESSDKQDGIADWTWGDLPVSVKRADDARHTKARKRQERLSWMERIGTIFKSNSTTVESQADAGVDQAGHAAQSAPTSRGVLLRDLEALQEPGQEQDGAADAEFEASLAKELDFGADEGDNPSDADDDEAASRSSTDGDDVDYTDPGTQQPARGAETKPGQEAARPQQRRRRSLSPFRRDSTATVYYDLAGSPVNLPGVQGPSRPGSTGPVDIPGRPSGSPPQLSPQAVSQSLPATLRGAPQAEERARTPVRGSADGSSAVATAGGFAPPDIAVSLCGGLNQKDVSRVAQNFDRYALSWDAFVDNPRILESDHLVFRINGGYHNWKTAAPFIMSLVLFNKPLPMTAQEELRHRCIPEEPPEEGSGWRWFWRAKSEPAVLPASAAAAEPRADSASAAGPEGLHRPSPKKRSGSSTYRTLFPTAEQLESLDLHEGVNVVEFSVVSKFQGKTTVRCALYLWNYSDKIVISDIDGTITKTDLSGHVYPWLGRDCTHPSVAALYSAIAKNGYRVVYMSSRSISYHHQTKKYLSNVQQDDNTLPDGPVLLSPGSFINALRREVINRNPQEFKIRCLRNVCSCFGESVMWAGFGNRPTDEVTYTECGVDRSRTFIIDPSGAIKVSHGNFSTTYGQLTKIADQLFPPISTDVEVETKDFNSFEYWRELPDPLPADIELLIE